jgi:hypothetical protein
MTSIKKIPDFVSHLKCPISKKLFLKPVLAIDGHVYEEDSLMDIMFFSKNKVSPVSQVKLTFNNQHLKQITYLVDELISRFPKLKKYRYATTKDIQTKLNTCMFNFDAVVVNHFIFNNNFKMLYRVKSFELKKMDKRAITRIIEYGDDKVFEYILSNSNDHDVVLYKDASCQCCRGVDTILINYLCSYGKLNMIKVGVNAGLDLNQICPSTHKLPITEIFRYNTSLEIKKYIINKTNPLTKYNNVPIYYRIMKDYCNQSLNCIMDKILEDVNSELYKDFITYGIKYIIKYSTELKIISILDRLDTFPKDKLEEYLEIAVQLSTSSRNIVIEKLREKVFKTEEEKEIEEVTRAIEEADAEERRIQSLEDAKIAEAIRREEQVKMEAVAVIKERKRLDKMEQEKKKNALLNADLVEEEESAMTEVFSLWDDEELDTEKVVAVLATLKEKEDTVRSVHEDDTSRPVDEEDVDVVVSQTGCTIIQAEDALRRVTNIVDAILELKP